MKILLATGIYPPAIGGPATYVAALARQLHQRGVEVAVLAYDAKGKEEMPSEWQVEWVAKTGGPFVRWNRYAKALRRLGKEADIIYCFSAVSVGVPLAIARLKKPKRILRLGGDFLWERYTDLGGRLSLRAFYRSRRSGKRFIAWLWPRFDHIVFSTAFQEQLYQQSYRRKLPAHSVIENALPEGEVELHERHEPLRLLYMGRFVRFKNLFSLLQAVFLVPHVRLTLAGEGPLEQKLRAFVTKKGLGGRVTFAPSVHGEEKIQMLREQDLMVIPSITDISPNAAVEARAVGLPVLLTEETGLSPDLTQGMMLRPLHTSSDITRAVLEAGQQYEQVARDASSPFQYKRTWEQLAEEHVELFRTLL